MPGGIHSRVEYTGLPMSGPDRPYTGHMALTGKSKVLHGTTTRADGHWGFDSITEPRMADFIEQKTGRRPTLLGWAEQVHGTRVLHVRSRSCLGEKADAFYTAKPGVALTVRTADCVPVFVDAGSAVGLAHAGMAGAVKGVVPKLLAALEKRTGEPANSFRVWMGPHICKKCYRMSENNKKWLTGYPDASRFIDTRSTEQFFDLQKVIKEQLRAAGVHRITGTSECTFHGEWFSARRDAGSSRMLSYIMLVDA